MTTDDSTKSQCAHSGMKGGQVGGFQNPGVCLQAFPSFLPLPLPLFYSLHFSRCNSLLPDPTETLATQATQLADVLCEFRAPSTLRRRNLKTEVSLWKRMKCFPSTLRRRNFKTYHSTSHFGFSFQAGKLGKSHDYRGAIVCQKPRFQNVFRPHENEKPAFSNFSGLM